MSDARTETFKLSTPIVLGERTIEELKYRKPIAKDLFNLPIQMTMRDLGNVISKVTGEPLDTIGRMSAGDFMAMQMKVQSFLESGQQTGETD